MSYIINQCKLYNFTCSYVPPQRVGFLIIAITIIIIITIMIIIIIMLLLLLLLLFYLPRELTIWP